MRRYLEVMICVRHLMEPSLGDGVTLTAEDG